jgi:3-hydroxyacyl-[acyl-carrier-protein] dehydratase
VRFIFVDRIVGLDPGSSIEVLKNVAASEDVFADHFPGFPVFPGALIVEVLEQAAQLLIADTHGFASVARLTGLSRVTFRQLVRPGDQLRARCERRPGTDLAWTIAGTASVDGRTVATATLAFEIEEARDDGESRAYAERLRETMRSLREPGRPETGQPVDGHARRADVAQLGAAERTA